MTRGWPSGTASMSAAACARCFFPMPPLGPKKWGVRDRRHGMGGDEEVSPMVRRNRRVQVLNTWIRKFLKRPKVCQPRRNHVLESGVFDSLLRTERIDDRPTLHVDDRVMAVLSNRCGGKTQHLPSFDLAHDLIEPGTSQMMA